MTPGGVDVVIPTDRPVELMELAVRRLFAMWPHGVVCHTDGRRQWGPMWYYEIPFGEATEFFVFRDEAARKASLVDPTNVDMIHLLRRDGELTVVMDPGSAIGAALVDTLSHTKFPGAVA